MITIVAKRAFAKSKKEEKGKGKEEKEKEGEGGEKKGKELLSFEEIGGIRLNLIDYANSTEKPVTEVGHSTLRFLLLFSFFNDLFISSFFCHSHLSFPSPFLILSPSHTHSILPWRRVRSRRVCKFASKRSGSNATASNSVRFVHFSFLNLFLFFDFSSSFFSSSLISLTFH